MFNEMPIPIGIEPHSFQNAAVCTAIKKSPKIPQAVIGATAKISRALIVIITIPLVRTAGIGSGATGTIISQNTRTSCSSSYIIGNAKNVTIIAAYGSRITCNIGCVISNATCTNKDENQN